MTAAHDKMFMKLDCGRWVSIHAFEYSYTYGGLVLGRPNAKLNEWIVEGTLQAVSRSWGKRKTHFIPPAVDDSSPKHPLLPPVSLRAWLRCDVPINHGGFDGSSLVVVWFDGECHTEPIVDVVFRAVRGLPWEELAQDFNL